MPDQNALKQDLKAKIGGCRRNPPATTPVPMGMSGGQMTMGMNTTFPMVQESMWCGEHPVIKAESVRKQMEGMLPFIKDKVEEITGKKSVLFTLPAQD